MPISEHSLSQSQLQDREDWQDSSQNGHILSHQTCDDSEETVQFYYDDRLKVCANYIVYLFNIK